MRYQSDFPRMRSIRMAQNQSPPAHYHPEKQKTYSPLYTLKARANKCYFDPSNEVLCKPPPTAYDPAEK